MMITLRKRRGWRLRWRRLQTHGFILRGSYEAKNCSDYFLDYLRGVRLVHSRA
jgi:hypothetical protein